MGNLQMDRIRLVDYIYIRGARGLMHSHSKSSMYVTNYGDTMHSDIKKPSHLNLQLIGDRGKCSFNT